MDQIISNHKIKRNRMLNRLDVKTVDSAKPKHKLYRLYDGGGLFVEISPNGSKRWRFKYCIGGKDNNLSLEVYPKASLKMAREKRNEIQNLITSGINPSIQRKLKKTITDSEKNSFEVVAREWLGTRGQQWTESYRQKTLRRLEIYMFPLFKGKAIVDINADELLSALRRIELGKPSDTAHRIFRICDCIFRYGKATNRTKDNPCPDLKGALIPVKEGHFKAITEPKKLSELLRVMDKLPLNCHALLVPFKLDDQNCTFTHHQQAYT